MGFDTNIATEDLKFLFQRCIKRCDELLKNNFVDIQMSGEVEDELNDFANLLINTQEKQEEDNEKYYYIKSASNNKEKTKANNFVFYKK